MNNEQPDEIETNESTLVSDTEEDHDDKENKPEVRRSGRESRPVDRLSPSMNIKGILKKRVRFVDEVEKKKEHCYNLMSEKRGLKTDDAEYTAEKSTLIARAMIHIREQLMTTGQCFGQQYNLRTGLKVFGEKGKKAAQGEMSQMHERICFTPISINDLTAEERKKAMLALMLLSQKKDGTIKGRMVYNGKPTREWLSREDSASPTASQESIMITTVIDAKERRDVMSGDVPNAFIQAKIPMKEKDNYERIIMKITGVLVDMLVQLDPESYGRHVVYENGKKVLYVQVIRAIYGMLQAALLWYQKFRSDLEEEGFKFNDYDPCVANKMICGKQQTIRFHVDDILSSHVDPMVNDDFVQWLDWKYGSIGQVKITRGKVHEYLGMTLDFSQDGKVIVDMRDYVKGMLESFPMKLKKTQVAATPASESLFNQGNSPDLDDKKKEDYHTMVAKGLFVSKRGRPDIHPTIAVLSTRVRKPNENDWNKLLRMMKYLNGSRDKVLTVGADDLKVVKWYVDAAFAVHPDFKSHTGAVMTMGHGSMQSISRKQKLNTRSSTEAELVASDDAATMILWTKMFLKEQGYEIERNILYQDNRSAILLEENGRKSAGKRSRALNIRYFFLTDQIEKKNLKVDYCPTDVMLADFMSKPLQGEKFRQFERDIMG